MLQRKQFHRAGCQLHAASGGTVRLGQHRDDLMFLVQCCQRADRKLRRAGKDDFHIIFSREKPLYNVASEAETRQNMPRNRSVHSAHEDFEEYF